MHPSIEAYNKRRSDRKAVAAYKARRQARLDGGPGSGNFGHAGRPGEIGGSGPAEYCSLSDKAKDLIKDASRYSGKWYDPDGSKAAYRTSLVSELKKSGVDITETGDDEWPYIAYATDLTFEENETINMAINGVTLFLSGDFSKEGYVQKCREAGVQPRLSEKKKEEEPVTLVSKSGKPQHDETPVYNRLNVNSVLNDNDIVKYSGASRELNPEGFEKYKQATLDAVKDMTTDEVEALHNYTAQFRDTNYQRVNDYLATGEGSEKVKKAAEDITRALDHKIGVDCITVRGAQAVHGTGDDDALNKLIERIAKGNFSKAGKIKEALEGQTITSDVAMSTSPNSGLSGYSDRPVQFIFKTPADAKAVDISNLSAFGGGRSEIEKKLAATGLFGAVSYETEVLYKPGTQYKIESVDFSVSYEKNKRKGQVFITASILPERSDSRSDADEPKAWITVNGTHVPLDEEGNAIGGGGLAGKEFKEAKSVKSSPKQPKFTRPDAQDKAIKRLAKRTANLKNEQYRIVDKDGKVVLEKKGDRHSVAATVGEKREYLKDAVSLHNHPDGGTFSPDDLSDFGYGATEMIIATPEGTYTLTNLKVGESDQYSGWYDMRTQMENDIPSDVSFTTLQKQAQENLKDCEERVKMAGINEQYLKMHDNGASREELNEFYQNSGYEDLNAAYKERLAAERRRLETEPFDSFYKENASKYGFEYKFEPAERHDSLDADRAIHLYAEIKKRHEGRKAVNAYRQRRDARLNSRMDYGVPGMKWGHHKMEDKEGGGGGGGPVNPPKIDYGKAGTTKVGSVSVANIAKAIDHYAEEIRGMDTEHSVVIDKSGNVFHTSGGAETVTPEGIDYDGAVVVHNHVEDGSFGEDDFVFLKANIGVAELQACSPNYNYYVKPLPKLAELSYNDAYRMVGGSIFDMRDDLQHDVMEALAKDGFVEYRRESIK